jgi:thiol:disulfide interchange protein
MAVEMVSLAWLAWLGSGASMASDASHVSLASDVPGVPGASGRAEVAFVVRPSLVQSGAQWSVRVRFEFPSGCYLYADKLACRIEGAAGPVVFALPAAVRRADKTGGIDRGAYAEPFEAIGALGPQAPGELLLTVFYQGCDELQCYFPVRRSFRLGSGQLWIEEPVDDELPVEIPAKWRERAEAFRVAARATGYLSEDQFLLWLGRSGDAEPMDASGGVWPPGGFRVKHAAIVGGCVLMLCAAAGWRRRQKGADAWRRPVGLAGLALVAAGLVAGLPGPSASPSHAAARSESFPGLGKTRQAVEADLPEALAGALELAQQAGRPVFLDFWATWCRNCRVMEQTTLRRPEVGRRLDRYVRLKAQAEQPDRGSAREMLEFFGVRGLPAYIILTPAASNPGSPSATLHPAENASTTN